jgi:soluble lytic murein transglycosylase
MAASVADRHRDSRLAPSALLMASTLASRAGDEAAAQALLVRLIGAYPDASEIPEALYLLGMSAEARGQGEQAVAAYRELTLLAPTTGYAAGASDRLAILARGGLRIPQFSLPQRIDRAERLLRGGVPQTAADEAERIASEARDPGLAVRALRIVAQASQRLGRHDVAARAIEMAVSRAPADRKPGLQLEQARLLARAGQKDKALPVLARVAATGAEAEAAEARYLNARLLEDLGRAAGAEEAYRALAARYPAREVAGSSLWRLGWIAYLRGDARGAEQSWTRLVEIPGGRALRLGALYWTARAKEGQGMQAAAERLYQRVLAEAPRSYYGMLAAGRAARPREPRDGDGPTIRLPANPGDAVAGDPGFARVDLLRRLGLVELAVLELDDVVQRSVGDTVRLYGFSGTYVKEERYHLALRILRRHFVGLATTGHPELPRSFWEMLYPFGWRSEMTQAAERAGLDPFFVAAVVREESSYYPRAVSRAGARGLMQLMPATAQPIAELRGWPLRGGELLDEPAANVELGTSFLATLLREFGDARLALAAYNAGPRRARQWWQARRSDDLEVFVEEIPFDETRHYVKRVVFSWEEYRRIYGSGH